MPTNRDALHCIECGCCPHEHEHQDHKPRWHKSQGVNVSGYHPIADFRAWRAGRQQEAERALEAERAMYDCGDWPPGPQTVEHVAITGHAPTGDLPPAEVDASAIASTAFKPSGPDAPPIGAYDSSPWPAPSDWEVAPWHS